MNRSALGVPPLGLAMKVLVAAAVAGVVVAATRQALGGACPA